jgi:hypothetical protein
VASRTPESVRFFEHGEVLVASADPQTRQAALRICVPCCLMHAVAPLLLGAGLVDNYSVLNPVSVWCPVIPPERFKPELLEKYPSMVQGAEKAVRQKLQELLELFGQMGKMLTYPEDAVPMLPIGTYVEFQYRCRIDDLPDAIIGMESVPVAGVPELRYAMAAALAHVLQKIDG